MTFVQKTVPAARAAASVCQSGAMRTCISVCCLVWTASAAGVPERAVAVQDTAAIFAPGVVSTAAPEFAVTFSPDGAEVYFNRATADRSSFPIYEARLTDGRWTQAEPVSFAALGRNPDPFITPDGTRLYFSSTRPKSPSDASTDLDLWYVERRGSEWGAAINAGSAVNSPANEVFASATRDGTLYFASDRSGRSEIYRSSPTPSGFAEPERLPGDINGEGGASNPLVSPDECWLFFAAIRSEGVGASDIYVSERLERRWTAPRNLGSAVNSAYAEFAPALSPDGRRLFFTSERPGIVTAPVGVRPPGDIYSIDLSVLGIRIASPVPRIELNHQPDHANALTVISERTSQMAPSRRSTSRGAWSE